MEEAGVAVLNQPFVARGNVATAGGCLASQYLAAWVIARLFLADNGYQLRFEPADAVNTVEAVAAGGLGEDQLAEWFRQRIAGEGTG